ncbi:MAG TPA: cytochrome P460 family protein [Pyrinomonadaceae bacterium]|nr:cytochrome P460 family protein [Pyrinomonadaceae bacterium]HNU07757.1 cytochrome P460 family protein [Pyrinomonadaceae bacterium]
MFKPVHESRYGFVFANEIAAGQMDAKNPVFAEGSIIVRESKVTADASSPEKVIAMVKHARGFSKKTGDWEFLSFDGELNLLSRATKSDCATCHQRAEKTDRVFRGYRP